MQLLMIYTALKRSIAYFNWYYCAQCGYQLYPQLRSILYDGPCYLKHL